MNLPATIAALALAGTSGTVEWTGVTQDGDYIRLRADLHSASYTACPSAPCLIIASGPITLDGDPIFTDNFEESTP